jgi:hypothetical protein
MRLRRSNRKGWWNAAADVYGVERIHDSSGICYSAPPWDDG